MISPKIFIKKLLPLLFISAACSQGEGNKLPVDGNLPTAPVELPYKISIVSGNNQVGAHSTTLPLPLIAKITDEINTPISNIKIYIQVLSGLGTTSVTEASSDSNGLVSTSYTQGPTLGNQEVRFYADPNILKGNPSEVIFTTTAIPGAPSPSLSSITGTGPVVANGNSISTISIDLLDSLSSGVTGITPPFSASGLSNTYSTCTVSDSNGISYCSLSSTVAETKSLSIETPIQKIDSEVEFIHGPASQVLITHQPTNANSMVAFAVSLILKDSTHNTVTTGIDSTANYFAGLNSGSGILSGTTSVSSSSGIASFTNLKINLSGTKDLIFTKEDTSGSGGTSSLQIISNQLSVASGTPSGTFSYISGTGPTVANGISTSNITIVLKDESNNPISGVVPTFSASGTSNTYGTCSPTDSNGTSSCTLTSIKAETKTLSITSPLSIPGPNVVFVHGPASSLNITSQPSNTISMQNFSSQLAIIDSYNNVITSGPDSIALVTVNISMGNGNLTGTIQSQALNGILSFNNLKIDFIGTKKLSYTKSDTTGSGGTSSLQATSNFFDILLGPAYVNNCSITGTSPVKANGIESSIINIQILDEGTNPISGITPQFSTTGSNNIVSSCTSTNSSGNSTCSLKSTTAENKTLSISTPVSKSGSQVTFQPLNGINLVVPIEMLGGAGLSSSRNISITFDRSSTKINPNDYNGSSVLYKLELVATNTTTNNYNVSLLDSNGISYTSITVNQSTTPKRFEATFTPNAAEKIYKIHLQKTTNNNQLIVYNPKIKIFQTAATKTKIYIPLITSIYNLTSSSQLLTDESNDTTSFSQRRSYNFPLWKRDDTQYLNYDGLSPWTFETLSSSSTTTGSTMVSLFKYSASTAVSNTITTRSGTTIGLNETSFATSSTNFDNLALYDVKFKSSTAGNTAYLFKAGLWLKLNFLSKALLYHRIHQGFNGNTFVDSYSRTQIIPSNYSNPIFSFESTLRNSNTNGIGFIKPIAFDSATTGTTGTVIDTPLSPDGTLTTKQLKTGGTFSPIDPHNYGVSITKSSGNGNLEYGPSYILIQVAE